MLFNSLAFAFFLSIVFLLYWWLGNRRTGYQNIFLVLASYFFYACWDWRFLSLIIVSSLIDYTIGLALDRQVEAWKRKGLLALSLVCNIGILGFFKYYNFFVQSFIEVFALLELKLHFKTLNIILPVGISFYTFQTLSYTIDVYRKRLEPTKDFIAFAGFVSFFPQLIAGPIERATHLLPQFLGKRAFHYPQAVDGMRQILWGLFKKVVVADNCAAVVDLVFSRPESYSGSTLLLGAVFFAFQIYGDFSGYSDIAIGIAKLFGFELKQNFSFPYFSRDIAEFWRRWHISLSTWFRDYLYIPLGGSRGSTGNQVRNVFIIFIVSGFWHGANWTFLVWGGLNALFFLPLLLRHKNRVHLGVVAKERVFPSLKEVCQLLVTFGITTLAWVFFRAESIGHAWLYLKGIFQNSLFSFPSISPLYVWLGIIVMIASEWIHRDKQHGLELNNRRVAQPIRWTIYLTLIFSIAFFLRESDPFIYFQF
ncbi:MAG: MBOAT family protein [Saprospiraceae bacterium]|nr:MBOAT family protein [Saprospiraceae bacterium]